MIRTFLPIAISLAWVGCHVPARDRHPPELSVPPSWSTPAGASTTEATPWWTSFHDPELTQWIETAMASNADLATLIERVALARAEGTALTSPSRPRLQGATGLRTGKEHTRESGFDTVDLEPWIASGALSWEIDWLGKWRDRREAARQGIRAQQADLDAGRLLLTAEVANAWFQLGQHQTEVQILASLLEQQQTILNLYRDRFQAGIAANTDLEQLEADLAHRQRQQVRARMFAETQVRRLDRLLGDTTRSNDYRVPIRTSPLVPPALPVALPADVLRSRPDLLAAEARLRAAFSMERAAYLDLFPSLSLRLAGTTASGSLTNPFKLWISEMGPRLDLPIWDPKRRAQSKVRAAQAKVAAADYRAVALRAIEEVEVALVQFHHRSEELQLAQVHWAKARSIRDRTQEKLQAGIVSEQELCEDEQQALIAEMDVWILHATLQNDAVAVYRTMGATLLPPSP